MTTLPTDLWVFGLGQLGELLASGALRLGMRVTPVLRRTPRPLDFSVAPPGTPLLVAAGEGWEAAVADIPVARRNDIIVLQNELFPSTLQQHGLSDATVLMVWFNRKGFAAPQPGPPDQVAGPHAPVVMRIHEVLGLPCETLSRTQVPHMLAAKYAFIAAINTLGVRAERTVGQWMEQDPATANAVVGDATQLAAALCGISVTPALEAAVADALRRHAGLPTRGRASAARLARAREHTARLGLRLPAFLGD